MSIIGIKSGVTPWVSHHIFLKFYSHYGIVSDGADDVPDEPESPPPSPPVSPPSGGVTGSCGVSGGELEVASDDVADEVCPDEV